MFSLDFKGGMGYNIIVESWICFANSIFCDGVPNQVPIVCRFWYCEYRGRLFYFALLYNGILI